MKQKRDNVNTGFTETVGDTTKFSNLPCDIACTARGKMLSDKLLGELERYFSG